MPLYEYFCPTCRERFELRRPLAAAREEATCARGHRAERVISAFAILGSGNGNAEAGGCCAGGACACGRS